MSLLEAAEEAERRGRKYQLKRGKKYDKIVFVAESGGERGL
ncbi:hypothetical protein [Metallumcola ferriviriculae]